jgi:uncharacterized repeat protein (TIGR03843 family)
VPGDERTLTAALSDPGVPQALAAGELEILGALVRASNSTFLARATGADGSSVLAVYKPRRGETPLWDFPDGTLCHREVAAYAVARMLGWPNVPPTVLRDGPEGEGSVQLFVAADPAQHYFTMGPERADDLRKVALFDVVVNNADRKGGHCLLGNDGRVHVVDHGVCFAEEPKLRTVIWDFAGDPVSPTLLTDLRPLADDLAGGPLRLELDRLLSGREVEATRRRLDVLLADGIFPAPGPGRPFPWPPL